VSASPPVNTAFGQKLLAKLQKIEKFVVGGKTEKACNKLDGFIKTVQDGLAKGKLTAGQATQFLADAAAIETTLGC
jgi:FIMAH domain